MKHMEHKEHFHGSDLEAIEKIYGIKKEDITSFGANVNPLGISPLLRKHIADNIDAITAYPDREYTKLRKAIADYTKVDADFIIAGNGCSELISGLMHYVRPKHAIVFAPSYSEYEHEITLSGGKCEYFYSKPENDFIPDIDEFSKMVKKETELVVICNPNNPTSYAMDNDTIRKILDICKINNALVMIDETYIEFAPDCDSLTAVPLVSQYDNLIILRGISKFFAAPGLRLGYAISSDKELLANVNKQAIPWSVNSLADVAAEVMFNDTDYISATRKLINEQRDIMYNAIKEIPSLKAYKPYANFLLVRILDNRVNAQNVFDAAIRKGLMIRDCATFESLDEHYFRFCFMQPDKNKELLEVIKCTLSIQE